MVALAQWRAVIRAPALDRLALRTVGACWRVLAFGIAACLILIAPPAQAELSALAQQGKAVMAKAQCNRCHAVTDASGQGNGLPPAPRAIHCVECHQWILGTRGDAAAIARQRAVFPDWDRYLKTIEHFITLPDLGTLTRRVDPAFIRRFLDAPFDLRPHLDESMIPLRLSSTEKEAVVAYLAALNGAQAVTTGAAAPEAGIDAARVAAGRQRFVDRGCAACHLVGNDRLVPGLGANFFQAMRVTAALAPNLRHVRNRMPRATLVRFISGPKLVDPSATMPPQALQPGDAEAIADYLLGGAIEVGGAPPAAAPRDVPLLDRPVSYEEVRSALFGRICVHCHMDPASNDGDGGAGNTGGLGFAGVELNLETYAGIKRGLRRNGKKVSILKPEKPGQPPLLLAALLRRHQEAARDLRPPFADRPDGGPPTDSARPGMPLGLPPIDLDRLRLVRTWIAQGAPGPSGE